jgi:hypothetical protein
MALLHGVKAVIEETKYTKQYYAHQDATNQSVDFSPP